MLNFQRLTHSVSSTVIAGPDSAIHGATGRRSSMDPRVRPEGDEITMVEMCNVLITKEIISGQTLRKTAAATGVEEVRLVSDIGDAITHPRALRTGLEEGWTVRTVRSNTGIFHPKLIVGGSKFLPNDLLCDASFAVVGSANLTRGGLKANVECSLLIFGEGGLTAASSAFKALWGTGEVLSDDALDAYEQEFARRNRRRSARDLKALGVADDAGGVVGGADELRRRASPGSGQRTMETTAAASAWAGLESFTGEYRFQIEFPRDAGNVLGRMITAAVGDNQEVNMACEDGEVRRMRFRYYLDNAMFRLNVPNDTPGVDWARANRTGIALISASDAPDAPLKLQILRPGREANNAIGRSAALGTWGKTPTRLYGWY